MIALKLCDSHENELRDIRKNNPPLSALAVTTFVLKAKYG